jgi:uncharacterized membrane protein YfcA
VIAELNAAELLFFAAVIVLSYAIRGSAGFGGVTVPMLAWIISLKVIAPMVAFFGLISSLAILRHDLRHVVWRDLWRILPWCAAGVAAGLYFFKTLDARTLAQGLGVFVLVYGSWSLWMTFRKAWTFKPPMGAITPVVGTIAGFVGTIFGSNAGAFFALYLDLLNHAKAEFRATVAAILLGLGVFRVSGYVAVGAYDHDALIACAAGLPLMALGAFLGNRIHANLEQLAFKRFVAVIVILSGLPLLLR